jgi:hypothetical protein
MSTTPGNEETEVTYPTEPNAEGFYYENAEDAAMEILTKVYENENMIKQTTLPKTKQVAVVRELSGKDQKEISRFMGKDPERYQLAALTVATTLDGQRQPIEVIEKLKMKDFSRVMSMYQDLNF